MMTYYELEALRQEMLQDQYLEEQLDRECSNDYYFTIQHLSTPRVLEALWVAKQFESKVNKYGHQVTLAEIMEDLL